MNTTRRTIGYLTATLHIGSGRAMWPGVVEAARQNNVNLFCFPGGGLGVQQNFEYQRNLLYHLVGPDSVDGLVSWASNIGVNLSPEEVVAFHQQYHPLPMVSLALPMAGIPALTVNSYDGMRAAIIHLVEHHAARKLAFVRGPESHYYAQERYKAYLDVLEEYGIAYNPQLVTPPLLWNAGQEAVNVLLDERHLRLPEDIEAIVAVSDLMATEMTKALIARGITVPADVAVVGFNDSAEGRLNTPPITSVALPFYDQGYRAVETLLAQLRGETVPEQTTLPYRLVIRQSCGCPSRSIQQAAVGQVPQVNEGLSSELKSLRSRVVAEMLPIVGPFSLAEASLNRLIDLFVIHIQSAALGPVPAPTAAAFLRAFEIDLFQVSRQNGDVTAWQLVLSKLRQEFLPYLSEAQRVRCEDLCGQARVLIGDMAQRVQAYRQFQAERQAETLRDIGQALISSFDVERLTEVLAERLPRLGIRSGYLALFDSKEKDETWARLVLAYHEGGRIELEPGGRRYLARQLVPKEYLPKRQYCFVVEPLFFQDERIGFVLFEVGPVDGSVYQVLSTQISSALKGALLLAEVQAARLAAEKADHIKTRLLANVSHEMRTPLNIILDYTDRLAEGASPAQVEGLKQIHGSAEHQLRVIDDLLDLSRAEINELDLYFELLDPRPLLLDSFNSLATQSSAKKISWQLQIPERLPLIFADPVRLRQILLNLLSNAYKYTRQGRITLGVEVLPPYLHIWVEDTGLGIPQEQQERIFEPFVVVEKNRLEASGIGLGLSITRRLVALHSGTLSLNSQPGKGSVFHIQLPLPSLNEQAVQPHAPAQPVLLLVSNLDEIAPEILEFSTRQGIAIQRLKAADNLDELLHQMLPRAFVWDLTENHPADWTLIRRLQKHPRFHEIPFVLYGEAGSGPASFIMKSNNPQSLLNAIEAACPAPADGPILIVEDDPSTRAVYEQALQAGFPAYFIHSAADGEAALEQMSQQAPSLVILDLVLPKMDGFQVLDWMRSSFALRAVPVVILSNKQLGFEDIKRLEAHTGVLLQSKGILSDEEMLETLERVLGRENLLPAQTSAFVKRAVAYLHQNYQRPLSRWEIAEAIGVNEDYLSRVFHRELGLSPWEYLNRYRIAQAKELLLQGNANIRAIAYQVGFKDQAYFSRVFHQLTGVSPQVFRQQHA